MFAWLLVFFSSRLGCHAKIGPAQKRSGRTVCVDMNGPGDRLS